MILKNRQAWLVWCIYLLGSLWPLSAGAMDDPKPAVTEHEVLINGQSVRYRATAGTLPALDSQGQTVAGLFYVYYQRLDGTPTATRPLTFSFNGGPGSSSVWMHIGYTGPRRLQLDPEGFPTQPYGLKDNPHSILDVTDLVYIDPVNTGFSRPLPGVDPKQFFGVTQDIQYLAAWLERFITHYQRWDSPKILKGESYGTTRVAGLSRQLQAAHRVFVDGVVLISPTAMGLKREGAVNAALILPHYAATAWYHQQLAPELQQRELEALLPEVETFALQQYLPALAKGGFLEADQRLAIANQVATYAGVTPEFVLNNNLEIPLERWRKELLRADRLTVGRLDARYLGVDRDAGGIRYDYDPAMSAWNQAFTPAINLYLRGELQYQTELSYNIFGSVSPWDREGEQTAEDLRRSMAENPWLKVLFQTGYFDGGTDYFSAKHLMWNLDPSGQFRPRLRFQAYRSGHMMYLRDEDLPTSNQHLREFILEAIPAAGTPARWQRSP
jgi:carboxypeptidase C (cathepsin A)